MHSWLYLLCYITKAFVCIHGQNQLLVQHGSGSDVLTLVLLPDSDTSNIKNSTKSRLHSPDEKT